MNYLPDIKKERKRESEKSIPGPAGAFLRGAALLLALIVPLASCFTGTCRAAQAAVFRRDPVIGAQLLQKEKEKAPEFPKIILKRGIGGRYSWVVEGTNVWQVMRADEELRQYMDRMKKDRMKKANK